MTATGLEPTTTKFVNEHSTIWPNWPLSVRLRTKWLWVRVQLQPLMIYNLDYSYLWRCTEPRLSYPDVSMIQLVFMIIATQFLSNQIKNIFNRNSHHRRSMEQGVLKNSAKFTDKHLWQGLFFIKLQAWGLYRKRESGTGVFLWILLNFLRTTFLQNTCGGYFCFSATKLCLSKEWLTDHQAISFI